MALFDSLPQEVSIYEVSPRDGLQNEATIVETDAKVRLLNALAESGLRRIEATSFVSPKWIPQLADAEAVIARLPERAGVTFSALVPNVRGWERARSTKIAEVAVFMSASETHNKKNVNHTIGESIERAAEVLPLATKAGVRVRGYVSTVWGCPYEGEIDPRRAVEIAEQLLGLGVYEISLGDTIGVGTPAQTKAILDLFRSALGGFDRIAMHMHDTRGTALANVLVGLECGVRTFDASVGGVGGCPYAPGAAGNLATEDLVYMLHGMGVGTGIDPERIWEAGRVAAAILGRELPGKVHKAGAQKPKRPN